jgi:hypothetical protein
MREDAAKVAATASAGTPVACLQAGKARIMGRIDPAVCEKFVEGRLALLGLPHGRQ